MRFRSVYTDPVGWAEMIAGTRRRYLVTSSFAALLGVAVVGALTWSAEGPAAAVGLGALGAAIAVEAPLYCLRALRALLVQRGRCQGAHRFAHAARVAPCDPRWTGGRRDRAARQVPSVRKATSR